MGAEPPLRRSVVRFQEGLHGLFLRPSCGPFPVNRFQEFIAVKLVAVTYKARIGTPEKPCFVLAPEVPDSEIAGDRSDIGQAVFLKTGPKELFRPLDFH